MTTTVVVMIFIFLIIPRSTSQFTDTISPKQPLKDGDILLSGDEIFALGFFSPSNLSTNRYIGVWYNKIRTQTVIWIANRDNPVNGTSGVLTVDRQRGLVLYGNNKNRTNPVWCSRVLGRSQSNTNLVAKLQDTGNLVLVSDENNSTILWQGFDYLTDNYLPHMSLGYDLRNGVQRFLTCWKSPEDPGSGNCTYRIDPTGYPQLSYYMNGVRIFRTGSWTGNRWSGIARMGYGSAANFSFVKDENGISVVYVINRKEMVYRRLVIDSARLVRLTTWQEDRQKWTDFTRLPGEWCDYYAKCGTNSNCDPSDSREFQCTCLPGFEPQSKNTTWDLSSDASGDCIRKRGANVCGAGEGFVKVTHVKLPETSNATVDMSLSLAACEQRCLEDCNCTAYSVEDEVKNFGCLMWHDDLVDTKKFVGNVAGLDLFVRVDSITLAKYANKSRRFSRTEVKLVISLGSVVIFIAIVLFIARWYFTKKMPDITKREIKNLFHSNTPNYLEESIIDETLKDSDIPLFNLHTIAKATNYFCNDNKLGEGGFGAVYKGVLPDGREIAVKRLSQGSGQGNQEFRNEVILISKLQHRNLVRILGCCFKKQEKMLIYEYLPNKSLDFFIFDESRRKLLDWKKRFEIICGIARGILYLHQDSRLRIIHRDLKASNILLDASMNPKISDFGLARIFGGDQMEACTKRVVGTYGYMAPEYAMDGLFSIKSDVYSFGVLLLEIIIGRKKIDYYNAKPDSNLVSHIWNLWRIDRVLEIVDSSLTGSIGEEGVLIKRCVQIGFLCVQDNPNDRPTMSSVVAMLGNDLALPNPTQPAFVFNKNNNYYDDGSRDASTTEPQLSYISSGAFSTVEPR